MNEAPGRMILRDGKPYLFFSGYSYLGMSHVPDFTNILKEGIDRYGAIFPSSRVSNTPLPLYSHLEHYLTQLTGTMETVTYASGFLACQAIGQLLRPLGQVLVGPGMHPAAGLGASSTDSFESWSRSVLNYVRVAPHDHYVLAAVSADPLKGVLNDFTFLQDLPKNKRFTVLIDDAHGIGWLGEHGEGVSSSLMHLPQAEYILVYSLAKALHVQGGAISCPTKWATLLRRSPYYTASTPMAPAWAHAVLMAGPLYEVQRARLGHNLLLIKAMITEALRKGHPAGRLLEPTALPLLRCKGEGLAAYLEQRGILISSFAYPDPSGPTIDRAVLSALHEEKDLTSLIRACNVFPDSVTNR